MTEEVVDTGLPPVDDGQEPIQPTDEGEPQEEPQEPQEPQEPAPSVEDIINGVSDKMMQKFQSWQGRRDKELTERIAKIEQGSAPQAPAIQPGVDFWDNPAQATESVARQVARQELQRVQKQDSDYTNSVIAESMELMQDDPLFQDREFGTKVVEDIKQNYPSLDKGLPPQMAARLLVSQGIANVHRGTATTKQNPLAGNTGKTVPTGVGTPPPAKPRAKVVTTQLNDDAKRMAKKWGYTEEQLKQVFPDLAK